MKNLSIALSLLLLVSASAHARANLCIKNLSLNVQGRLVNVSVDDQARVKATVNGKETEGAYLTSSISKDKIDTITLELGMDQKPVLTPDQTTEYDGRLDHHSILILDIKVDEATGQIQTVEYKRYQEIDYGYGSASNLLKFSVVNIQTCKR